MDLMITGKIASVCVDMARYVCVCMCVYIQILLLPRDRMIHIHVQGFIQDFWLGRGGGVVGRCCVYLATPIFLQPTLL